MNADNRSETFFFRFFFSYFMSPPQYIFYYACEKVRKTLFIGALCTYELRFQKTLKYVRIKRHKNVSLGYNYVFLTSFLRYKNAFRELKQLTNDVNFKDKAIQKRKNSTTSPRFVKCHLHEPHCHLSQFSNFVYEHFTSSESLF